MKAVILVGGEGTRLRPLTYDIPKPMVPIVNKPYMEHQIDALLRHGFDEIVFALGYKSDAFASYFGDGSAWGARFWHVVEDEPLGTAGAVKNVEALLDDTFLVFNQYRLPLRNTSTGVGVGVAYTGGAVPNGAAATCRAAPCGGAASAADTVSRMALSASANDHRCKRDVKRLMSLPLFVACAVFAQPLNEA